MRKSTTAATGWCFNQQTHPVPLEVPLCPSRPQTPPIAACHVDQGCHTMCAVLTVSQHCCPVCRQPLSCISQAFGAADVCNFAPRACACQQTAAAHATQETGPFQHNVTRASWWGSTRGVGVGTGLLGQAGLLLTACWPTRVLSNNCLSDADVSASFWGLLVTPIHRHCRHQQTQQGTHLF